MLCVYIYTYVFNSTYVHIYTYTIYITSYITDAYCICRQLGISDDGLSCELLPRFNEWGRSVADLQINRLQGTQTGQQCPDWHFLCFVNPDDIDAAPLHEGRSEAFCRCQPDSVARHGQGWWDESPTAGPKSRPADPFPTPLPSLSALSWNGREAAQQLNRIFSFSNLLIESGLLFALRNKGCPTLFRRHSATRRKA